MGNPMIISQKDFYANVYYIILHTNYLLTYLFSHVYIIMVKYTRLGTYNTLLYQLLVQYNNNILGRFDSLSDHYE